MKFGKIPTYFRSNLWLLLSAAFVSSLIIVPSALAVHVVGGADVKVTRL